MMTTASSNVNVTVIVSVSGTSPRFPSSPGSASAATPTRRGARSLLILTVLAAVLLAATGCADEEAAACIQAPAGLITGIEQGLTVTGGGSLRDGWAVRSGDFEKVYFVAAEIDGPGLTGDGEVGVWATNDLDEPFLIFAVNGLADEFTDWGDAGEAELAPSMSDDGAREARDCAR